MQRNIFISVLENEICVKFISQNLSSNLVKLALSKQKSAIPNFETCLVLLKYYQKATFKIPTWIQILPALSEKSLMQSTSENVATYKASLISGHSLLDITGGIGVDDWAFSKCFNTIDSFEIDEDIHQMATYNLKKLGSTNIKRHLGQWQKNKHYYDWIYIDPDRRIKSSKSVALHNMEPDVMSLLPDLWEHSAHIMLKLSPLFDVTLCVNEIPNVKHIRVISEKNDVKELNVVLEKNYASAITVEAIDISQKVFTYKGGWGQYPAEHSRLSIVPSIGYIYLPLHGLTKSGLSGVYFSEKGMTRIFDYELFFSENYLVLSGGRCFSIKTTMRFSTKKVTEYLKNTALTSVSVVYRGTKANIAKMLQDLKIKEGGLDLLLLLGYKKETIFVHCSVVID